MKKLLFLFILLVSGLTFSQTKNISETKSSNNQNTQVRANDDELGQIALQSQQKYSNSFKKDNMVISLRKTGMKNVDSVKSNNTMNNSSNPNMNNVNPNNMGDINSLLSMLMGNQNNMNNMNNMGNMNNVNPRNNNSSRNSHSKK